MVVHDETCGTDELSRQGYQQIHTTKSYDVVQGLCGQFPISNLCGQFVNKVSQSLSSKAGDLCTTDTDPLPGLRRHCSSSWSMFKMPEACATNIAHVLTHQSITS